MINTITKLAKDNRILKKGVLIQNKRSEVRIDSNLFNLLNLGSTLERSRL
jgi:hypothetical protein